jgi:hypothetical protein
MYVGRYLPGASIFNGTLRLRGGRGLDTAGFVDGFRVRRLGVPMGMLGRADVVTAGYGAELADVAGGAIELATKTGSNRLGADVDVYYESHEQDLMVAAPTLSGPLLRDRLFFVASARIERARTTGQTDPSGIFPAAPTPTAGAELGALKLTWRPSPAHQVDSLTSLGLSRTDNSGEINVSPEAQPAADVTGVSTFLRWSGKLGAGVTASAGVGWQRAIREDKPELCRQQPGTCDSVPAMINRFPRTYYFMNGSRHERLQDDDLELTGDLEARLGGPPGLEQRLRVSSRIRSGSWSWQQATPGGRIIELNGPIPDSQTEVVPAGVGVGVGVGVFRSEGSVLRTIHAVQDDVRLQGRLWLMPGVALVTSRARAGGLDINQLAFAPRLGVSWDAAGDGRTWLRASSARRVPVGIESAASSAAGSPVTRRCKWNADTGSYSRECVVSGGNGGITFGLPCGPSGVQSDGTSCDSSLALPVSWEHTVGATRLLGGGLALDLDLVYRRMSGLPSGQETNRIWVGSPAAPPTGYRSGRAQTVIDWSSSAEQLRQYLGLTVALQKRTGAARFLLAYTLSHLQTTTYEAPPNALGDLPPTGVYLMGDDPDDRRHAVRALASYDLLGFSSLGLAYVLDSGRPAGRRLFASDPSGAYENYRATIGVNPGLNDPAAVSDVPRQPATQQLSLQLRLRARRLTGVDLDFYGEALHVLHDGTASYAADGASFLPGPEAKIGWRIGAAYRY